MKNVKWKIFLLINGLLLLSGCSHQFPLIYDPIIEMQPPKHITISLEDIEDHRKNKKAIAFARNILFIPVHQAQSIQSPASWLSYAIENELTNAGYTVMISDDSAKYKLKGDLYNLFYDCTFIGVFVSLKVEFTLFEDDLLVFNKIYDVSRLAFTRDNSLQEICKELISDLDTYFELLKTDGGRACIMMGAVPA